MFTEADLIALRTLALRIKDLEERIMTVMADLKKRDERILEQQREIDTLKQERGARK